MMYFFGGVLSLIELCGFSFQPVHGAGFTVSPMLQEVVLDESTASVPSIVTVTNETSTIATFELSVIDFGSLDESGGIAFLGAEGDLERKYGLASWMQPETNSLTLAPGAERSVKVRIENREDLSPGGHYGALVFRNVSIPSEDEPNVAINQVFTALVFAKKTGGAMPALELSSVEHVGTWYAMGQEVSIRFKNSGNVHVTPRGIVEITDPLGKLVSRGILNEGSAIVLPETYRSYPTDLRLMARSWLPGFYTLLLQHRFEGQETMTVWSKRFFHIPLMFWFIVGSMVLVAIGYSVYRKRTKSTT